MKDGSKGNYHSQPKIKKITINNPKLKGQEVLLSSPPTFSRKENKQYIGTKYTNQNFQSTEHRKSKNSYDYVFNPDFDGMEYIKEDSNYNHGFNIMESSREPEY